MSIIEATLYFTFPWNSEICDIGSYVDVDTATGEFNGEQAFNDMLRLTETETACSDGCYLQVVADHRFEVENKVGSLTFRVLDLDGLRCLAAGMEPEPDGRVRFLR